MISFGITGLTVDLYFGFRWDTTSKKMVYKSWQLSRISVCVLDILQNGWWLRDLFLLFELGFASSDPRSIGVQCVASLNSLIFFAQDRVNCRAEGVDWDAFFTISTVGYFEYRSTLVMK